MQKSKQPRKPKGGYQISEFAVSLFFLISCVVLPLINLSVIPVRYGLGNSMVSTWVQQRAQSETLGTALQDKAQANLLESLNKIGGIRVKASQLALIVESAKLQGQTKVITKPGNIDKDWLPDGPIGPYVYRLEAQIECEISPLVVLPVPNVKVPGLTSPFAVNYHNSAVWENTGRDPATGEFFVNE